MILYSIIVPTYNTGHCLIKCLESVKRQTYNNWEMIIVDDGSEDIETIKICDRYAKMDNRIRVFHKAHEGCFVAREFGIKAALGEYCLFLDSDDWYYSFLLYEVNNIILQDNPDTVLFRLKRDGARIHKRSPKLFDNGTIINKGSKDWRKVVKILLTSSDLNNIYLKAVKRELATIDVSHFVGIIYGEDRLKSIPILLESKKIVYLDKVLYCYHNNPNGLTRTCNAKSIEQRYLSQCIIQKAEKRFLKEYCLDSRKYLRMFYQAVFRRKVDLLILSLKDVKCQHNKDFLNTLLNDAYAHGMLKYCTMRGMKFKYAICFGLYKKGILIDLFYKIESYKGKNDL